jgi:hypothetical protein
MLWPLYPQGKNSWYPMLRRLGGLQKWSKHVGEEKYICPSWESNPSCPTMELTQLKDNLAMYFLTPYQ